MNDAKMTPHQLHLEVLKAMGWTYKVFHYTNGTVCSRGFVSPNGIGMPQPPLTLDLMWQAEEMLGDEQRIDYVIAVGVECDRSRGSGDHNFDIVHATAEQRARAFLKVKGIA